MPLIKTARLFPRLPLPVAIVNSYCTFDEAGADSRRRAAEWVRRFGAKGVKFNLGNEPARTAERAGYAPLDPIEDIRLGEEPPQ